MSDINIIIEELIKKAYSPLKNYIIPGLTSSLITAPSEDGCIRLFESSREHQEQLTPHSHRFDFKCYVVKGWVTNIIWNKEWIAGNGDRFVSSTLTYQGAAGKYKTSVGEPVFYSPSKETYQAGDWYSMRRHQIHSIQFSRNAQVLFFEGKTETDESVILEPEVDGTVIRTFKTEKWMFKSE
jgi:WD40 repeat protein